MAWTTPKTFVSGERLLASDLNTYVSDNLSDLDLRTVKSFADASARTTAIPSPAAGAVTFLEDTDAVEVYDGSAWVSVGSDPNPGIGTNVVQTVKTDTFATTSTSYVDVTGLTATITPTSASSKVLVVLYALVGVSANNAGVHLQLVRDATVVFEGAASGSKAQATFSSNISGNYDSFAGSPSYLDAPATTSSVTYKIQMKVGANTGYLGRAGAEYDSGRSGRNPSSLTLIEVAV